jgi:hypothetical protein
LAWRYAKALLSERLGKEILEAADVIQIISEWQDNYIRLNNLILKDAEKEFDNQSRVGYGLDGDEAVRDADFSAVRGTLADNKFIIELQKESEQIARQAEQIIAALS